MKVTGITLTGGSYRRGHYYSGFATASLENGQTVFLGGENVQGFAMAADIADAAGYETAEYRVKLNNWVKTGRFELEPRQGIQTR